MSVVGALFDALDRGLVVFKTDSGLVVAGHPINNDAGAHAIANLVEVEMVWDLDDVGKARCIELVLAGAREAHAGTILDKQRAEEERDRAAKTRKLAVTLAFNERGKREDVENALRAVLEWPLPLGTVEKWALPGWLAESARRVLS